MKTSFIYYTPIPNTKKTRGHGILLIVYIPVYQMITEIYRQGVATNKHEERFYFVKFGIYPGPENTVVRTLLNICNGTCLRKKVSGLMSLFNKVAGLKAINVVSNKSCS